MLPKFEAKLQDAEANESKLEITELDLELELEQETNPHYYRDEPAQNEKDQQKDK